MSALASHCSTVKFDKTRAKNQLIDEIKTKYNNLLHKISDSNNKAR